MELHSLTGHELQKLLQSRQVSASEIAQAFLARIEETEEKIHAFISVTADRFLEEADRIDAQIAGGEELSPLAGLPMGIKDNLCTKGIPTTCASQMLENYLPPFNATVVSRLKAAGSFLAGKLNMDEFAMGSSGETSYFGPTCNPWNLQRVPGGSSSGSAAAVAAGQVVFSLGTDTGGSIRQPAALCGVVGLKPTYGLVSRYGLVPFASSLDHIGPITRDVRDCALVLKAIAGHDPLDATSKALPVPDYAQSLVDDVKGLRIGLPREYLAAVTDGEVSELIRKALVLLEGMGAIVEEISLPHTQYALPAYYVIATAEASSNLARFDGVRYGYRNEDADDVLSMFMKSRGEAFGSEVKFRIILGTHVLTAGGDDSYYAQATRVRTLVKQELEEALEKYHVLISPSSPAGAFLLGEKAGKTMDMYYSDLLTIPANLAGLPALSLPCGFSQGLPVGLQIIGRAFDEATLLRVAYTLECHTGYRRQIPSLEVK
ncbi:MAG: Asp-tRNA(Asn)/Glu-tRNA(Gln) amidotransferase subunit GatA [Bacillota bacterium]